MRVHSPNSHAPQLQFVEEISDALGSVKTNESTILLGDLNAHFGNDPWVCSSVVD